MSDRETRRSSAYHDRKDTLLHFSGVLRAEDDHFHTLKVDLHRGRAAHTLGETVGRELASIVDDKVGLAECRQFFLSWADQHIILWNYL
jgi:hypothetical protein